MPMHEKLDYVEFAASDLEATKVFFEQAFGWTFTNYGRSLTSRCNCFSSKLPVSPSATKTPRF